MLQGARTFILQDSNGQIMNTHSISAGLDYAAVGPEHAWLRDEQRVEYTFCTDDEALKAFRFLSETEGIIPAMESAHAIAEAMKLAPTHAAGPDDHRQSLRPRRQGRAAGRAGFGVVSFKNLME